MFIFWAKEPAIVMNLAKQKQKSKLNWFTFIYSYISSTTTQTYRHTHAHSHTNVIGVNWKPLTNKKVPASKPSSPKHAPIDSWWQRMTLEKMWLWRHTLKLSGCSRDICEILLCYGYCCFIIETGFHFYSFHRISERLHYSPKTVISLNVVCFCDERRIVV